MFQVSRPLRMLLAICTSHIIMAHELKQIVDIVCKQEKNFSIFDKDSFSINHSSSLQKPVWVMALTTEICEKFGDIADPRIHCFLCKEIGHRKFNFT